MRTRLSYHSYLSSQCDSIAAVMEAGKRHGVPYGDLYGSLYFYLTEQLREFADRLSRFHIKITVLRKDARNLAKDIKDGHLAPTISPSITFDRIEVSNTLDHEYIGIPRLLADWSAHLNKSDDAAIVGSFMNWAMRQPGGAATSCNKAEIKRLTEKMIEAGRVRSFYDPFDLFMTAITAAFAKTRRNSYSTALYW